MFGIYRFTLAHLVVIWHMYPGAIPASGPQAVYAFFVLSGYLMTRVVNERYADGLRGFLRYLGNRALRIYPPYLACLALIVILWIVAPEATTNEVRITTPMTLRDMIAQVSIVGLVGAGTWLIPPAWSLDVELAHYLLIGAIFARSRRLTLTWLVISAPFAALAVPDGRGLLQPDYVTYTGGSICFAAGATLAHFLSRQGYANPWQAPVAIAAIPVLGLVSWTCAEWARNNGMIVTVILAVYATMVLARVRLDQLPRWLHNTEDWCGRLAYPIFLSQFNAAVLVSWLAVERLPQPVYLVAGLLLTIAISIVIVILIDRPLETLRRQLRQPT